MAISPTRSVTEQTADLTSPHTEIHSQSWQYALDDARHHALLSVTTLKPALHPAITSQKTAFSTEKIQSATSVPGQTSNTPQKPTSGISANKSNHKPKKAEARHHHSTTLITAPLTQNAQPVLPETKPDTSPKPAHEDMDMLCAPVEQRLPTAMNSVAIAEPVIPRAPTQAAAPPATAQVQQQASPTNPSPTNSKTLAASSVSSSSKITPTQRASSRASTSKLVAERFAAPAMANKPVKPQQPAQSPPVSATLELNTLFQSPPTSPTMPTSQEPVTTTATSAAALAATVTALHQAGQTGAILRLAPPGLGHLSIQIGQTTHGQINIMFVPSTADAAQTLQNALPQLHQALSQSGLTLGQAQVGGEFSHSGGQGGQKGHNNPATPAPTAPRVTVITTASTPILSGLSAYA